MALPNMAMIPSGYKPTKLYSVLPTPTYGSDLVTNGDFSNGSTDWTVAGNVSISGGKLNFTNAATNIDFALQAITTTLGVSYKISLEVSNLGSGESIKVRYPIQETISTNGTHSLVGVSDGTPVIRITPNSATATCSIDNISVQEVLVGNADFDVTRATPATRVNQYGLIETPEFILSDDLITNGDFDTDSDWFKGSGWTISGGKASCDGVSSNSSLYQIGIGVNGDTYKISGTISDYVSGTLQVGGSSRFLQVNTNGDFVHYREWTADPTLYLRSVNFSGSIDNISVVQVERNNIPRLDYTDGGCPVLLTEPQSINRITYSEDFSKWLKTSGVTTTSAYGISPSGLKDSTRIQLSTSNEQVYIASGTHSGNTEVASLYIKGVSGESVQFGVGANTGQGSTVTLNGNWQRITQESTSGSILIIGNKDATATDFEVWAAQLEELSYPTSYIPTNGSTVTRNQDIVNNAGTSATYNSVEGVLFAEIAALVDSTDPTYVSLSDGTVSNRICILLQDVRVRPFYYLNNVQQLAFSISVGDNSVSRKIAFKYKENDFSVWIDGVEVASNTSGSTFPINTLNELTFDNGGGGNPFYGKTKQVQVFNTALSNFDLLNLTSNATGYATYETMRTSLNFNIQ